MKTILIILAVGLLLLSCDKRADILTEDNHAPEVSIQINNQYAYLTANVSANSVVDSCKYNRYYRFELSIQDESPLVNISFTGDGNLFMNGSSFQNGDYANGTYQFEWNDSIPGLKSFEITVMDPLGGEKTYYFGITVFENIPPSISWQLIHVGQLSPLEKKIEVSGNDGDVYFGGGIIYYQYIINGDTTNYPSPNFFYVFPQAGQYNIGVRAMDSDYEWSNEVTINNYQIN